MSRALATLVLALFLIAGVFAGTTLDLYFIDVEGGQSTLIVTPAGKSMLIDAGYRGGRDAGRIAATARQAGLDHLDYVLLTHFHPDHVGGVPELAAAMPIRAFIDNGAPLGSDRMTRGFSAYEPIRNPIGHIVPRPGDTLPMNGLDVTVVSSGGDLLSSPLPGAGRTNGACASLEHQIDDGTENYRSLGVMVRYGAFRFLDLGDLSGDTLGRLVCPINILGTASVYLVAHHGDYDSNLPAFYAAVRPQVAIMNNGITKGGSPEAFKTLHAQPFLEDLWQLHASRNSGARNWPDDFIANLGGEEGPLSYGLHLSAFADGSFRVVNDRNGFSKSYQPRK